MSNFTLHLYNLQNDLKLDSYLSLLDKNDSVVLFNTDDNSNINDIKILVMKYCNNVNVITTKSDYSMLVELLKTYKRTMTWK